MAADENEHAVDMRVQGAPAVQPMARPKDITAGRRDVRRREQCIPAHDDSGTARISDMGEADDCSAEVAAVPSKDGLTASASARVSLLVFSRSLAYTVKFISAGTIEPRSYSTVIVNRDAPLCSGSTGVAMESSGV